MPANGRRAKRSIVNILFSSCSAMVRFAEPRLALRPFIEMSEANLDERIADLRWAGFLPLNIMRSTKLSVPLNCLGSTKPRLLQMCC